MKGRVGFKKIQLRFFFFFFNYADIENCGSFKNFGYIYIYIEREREREISGFFFLFLYFLIKKKTIN